MRWAAGSDALELLGRPGVAAIWPITDGTILDLQRTAAMLRHLIATLEPDRSIAAPGWSRRSPAG